MSKSGLTNLRKFVDPVDDSQLRNRGKSAIIVRLPARRRDEAKAAQKHVKREADRRRSKQHYRDAICSLCERVVSIALNVSLVELQSKSRSKADVAMARQIAMYLAHTKFRIILTEIGLHFRRDRTTVSYACAQVEDKRDEFSFDLMICQLEALLGEALEAITHCQLQAEQEHTPENKVMRPLLAQLSFLETGEGI